MTDSEQDVLFATAKQSAEQLDLRRLNRLAPYINELADTLKEADIGQRLTFADMMWAQAEAAKHTAKTRETFEAALMETPDDSNRYEVINGVITRKKYSTHEHSILGAWLTYRVGIAAGFLKPRADRAGEVTAADGAYWLSTHEMRCPDVGYITAEHAATLPAGTFICTFAPDFAIEILFPDDPAGKADELAFTYLRCGTTSLWVVDIEKKTVRVYGATDRRKWTVCECSGDDILESSVVPELQIACRELFDEIKGM